MDDDCKEDICKYVSNELPAFINRTKVLFFSRGMPAAFKKYLPIMLRWAPNIMAGMARKYSSEVSSIFTIFQEARSRLLAMDVAQMF